MVKRKRHILVELESTKPNKAQHIEVVARRWLEEFDKDELGNVVESNVKQVHFNGEAKDFIPRSYFSRAHWETSTIEIVVRIEDFEEPVVALVDLGFDINVMSKSLYLKGNGSIDTENG
ncbi:hypothetical protein L7F22_032311 [Adiantum nelumboides]|nr:hypothetical protein [Adiantum nelumboides]